MKLGAIVLTAVLLAGIPGPAAAHHSAAQFDFSRSVEITGVVTKFAAINPHMRLVLRVKDAKGTREVEFEGHSTNNMYRAGYRDKMIQVGDTVTVFVAPLRDGSDGGYVTAAQTAKGQRFGMGSQGQGQERQKAEGR
jgi:hypothetical protein